MNDEKYLDPKTNPFIPDPFKDEVELPAGTPGADGLAPMMDLSLKPEDLARKLEEIFPDRFEVEAGGVVIQKMATGHWTVKNTGQPITDLGLPALMALNDFLKDQQKG